ncbi:MAG: DNA polymerase III subunit beta [Spirochaetales bacterium]|nr:MAG: DNA polymerase III subunit beta [Spirochaetales bacterium]
MKFTADRNMLLREIATSHEIIASKNPISILSNVLLSAENETLLIKATDLKVSFETQIPVDVQTPGSITVICDKFLNIIRALPEGSIDFVQEDSRLAITPSGGLKTIFFQLATVSAEKYPELQIMPEEHTFEIAQKELIEMIDQTIFAVSDDETRYFMNGVFLDCQDEKDIIMVATDGRRLSYIRKELTSGLKSFRGIIIPPKVLNLIKKLLPGEGMVTISISEKSIFFSFNKQKISSNLIEGQFPDYRRVVPVSQHNRIEIERKQFIDAIKRVSLLVEQKSRRIYLHALDNSVTLSSEESEYGVAREQIMCSYEGAETKLALNYIYLEEPLKQMQDEKISIKFSEQNKALTLVSVPEKDFFHIIMPMQLE